MVDSESQRIARWFGGRPDLQPEFLRLLRRKRHPLDPGEHTRRAAERWCDSVEIGVGRAYEILTGAAEREPLDAIFPRELAEARRRVQGGPSGMGGEGAVDLLFHLCEHLGATRVVETGVARGWSSLAILLSLARREGGRLLSTDMPHIARDWDEHVGLAVPESLRRHWTLLRVADRQGLPRAQEILGAADLCHYDSDKTFEGRCWAYPRLWAGLRPGGVFVSDDVGDNVAFQEFAERVGQVPVVIRWKAKFVGILRKDERR